MPIMRNLRIYTLIRRSSFQVYSVKKFHINTIFPTGFCIQYRIGNRFERIFYLTFYKIDTDIFTEFIF